MRVSCPTVARLAMIGVVVVLLCSVHSAECTSVSSTRSQSQIQVRYSLGNHRLISEMAYDAIKAELIGERKRDWSDEHKYHSVIDEADPKYKGMLGRIKLVADRLMHKAGRKYEDIRAAANLNIGTLVDKARGARLEAEKYVDESDSFEEFCHRVNLRLGTTYPDVPVPGNMPVFLNDSLADISLRLFTLRHVKSISATGLKKMASTHEGDKQYWHSMASGMNAIETNIDVKESLFRYIKYLYDKSRWAIDEKRWWYYGRILHAIQDSYSDAHCARDTDNMPTLPIRFFENYSNQEGSLHALSDTSPSEDAEALRAKDGDEAELKLRRDLLPRKRKLWNRAIEMSKEFLRIVFVDGSRKDKSTHRRYVYENTTVDQWPQVEKVLQKVFALDKANGWDHAEAGGTKTQYTKEGAEGRSDQGRPEIKVPRAWDGSKTLSRLMTSTAGKPESFKEYTLVMTKVLGQDFGSGDIFGENEVWFMVRGTDLTGAPYHSEVSQPVSRKEVDGILTNKWEFSRKFIGVGRSSVHFDVYDSDTLLGLPEPHEKDLIGQGKIHVHDFINKEHPGEPTTVTIPLFHEGEDAGRLIVTVAATPIHQKAVFDNHNNSHKPDNLHTPRAGQTTDVEGKPESHERPASLHTVV
jgi:hypothetical protein